MVICPVAKNGQGEIQEKGITVTYGHKWRKTEGPWAKKTQGSYPLLQKILF